jgi:acetyl-CoA carboxylase biotin carboxylase subunit
VTYLHAPSGPGVRWDSGVDIGSEVGLFYDAMLAKLIVWGPTRAAAIERMHRALGELTIDGVETSRDFHLRVMEDAEFRRGAIDIQWLERRLSSLVTVPPPQSLLHDAAIVAAVLADQDRARLRGPAPASSSPPHGTADGARGSAWHRAARLEALR